MGIRDLFSTPRNNVVASILQFPAIDTDGMAKRMCLRERAKEQALANLPASDSTTFDAVEQEIINEIENEGKTQFNAYLNHQKTYSERANDAGVQALVLQIGTTAADAVSDFERHTRVGSGELYAARREVIDTEKELKRFRTKHRLDRTVRDIGSRVHKIGILILILAIESLLNGFFLQKGNVFGLAGGVFEALLIASINVFVGVAVGRLVFPLVAYRNVVVRISGILLSLLYLALAVGFNIAVAHYRNAVAADPFEASVTAYNTLFADPLGIHDLESWSLFIFGFSFSLIAAYDGLRMDDPYPGYGNRMRQNLAAIEAYNDLKQDLVADLEEIKKSAEEKMDDLTRNIETRQREQSYIIVKSDALNAEMSEHLRHLQAAGNTLLRLYRDENSRFRTIPVPSRFEQTWIYNGPKLTTITTLPSDDPDEFVRRTIGDLPKHRSALHEAYSRSLAEYEKIAELVE